MASNPRTVLSITAATLKLADSESALASGAAEFSGQVALAAVTATPNIETAPATLTTPASDVPAATSYGLDLEWLQDWDQPGGGLSAYAFTNDTAEKWFSLALTESAAPLCTGRLRVVAGAFGGTAGTPLTATATWPVQGKPTITTPAAAP